MICTATIYGVHCEINGTPEECFRFVSMAIDNPKPKKVCDPLARHYGNCGARECPIIAPHESLAAYQYRTGNL